MLRPPPPHWFARAACHDVGPDVFFEGPPSKAKQYCQRCAVVVECLQYALDDPSLGGVWGGLTGPERENRRRRQRAS